MIASFNTSVDPSAGGDGIESELLLTTRAAGGCSRFRMDTRGNQFESNSSVREFVDLGAGKKIGADTVNIA
jgi:hypothetical protein